MLAEKSNLLKTLDKLPSIYTKAIVIWLIDYNQKANNHYNQR
jgi:hypothetical protein